MRNLLLLLTMMMFSCRSGVVDPSIDLGTPTRNDSSSQVVPEQEELPPSPPQRDAQPYTPPQTEECFCTYVPCSRDGSICVCNRCFHCPEERFEYLFCTPNQGDKE